MNFINVKYLAFENGKYQKKREMLVNTDNIEFLIATEVNNGGVTMYNISGLPANTGMMNSDQFLDFQVKLGVKIPINKG